MCPNIGWNSVYTSVPDFWDIFLFDIFFILPHFQLTWSCWVSWLMSFVICLHNIQISLTPPPTSPVVNPALCSISKCSFTFECANFCAGSSTQWGLRSGGGVRWWRLLNDWKIFFSLRKICVPQRSLVLPVPIIPGPCVWKDLVVAGISVLLWRLTVLFLSHFTFSSHLKVLRHTSHILLSSEKSSSQTKTEGVIYVVRWVS